MGRRANNPQRTRLSPRQVGRIHLAMADRCYPAGKYKDIAGFWAWKILRSTDLQKERTCKKHDEAEKILDHSN